MARSLNIVVVSTLLLGLSTMAVAAQQALRTPERTPAPPVTLEQASPVTANEGHLRLSWKPEGEVPDLSFELERSLNADFREVTPRKVGADRSSYVSGLRQGENYFRVRAVTAAGDAGPWSEALVVRVDYPSRRQVFVLMAVGAVLLIATVVLILTGHARRRGAREG
jgi:hypothetical protein